MSELAAHRKPARGRIGLQEAADRLGVHYMTAYRYVRTGRLPALQEGGQWWVEPDDLAVVAARTGSAGRRRAGAGPPARTALRRRLEDRLVGGDEAGAWAIVEGTLGSGATPEEVLLDLLGGALRAVGDGWESGRYTVDDEHRATAVAQRVVARLGPRFARRGPKRRGVILGTPPGEHHGLPTAIAADVLRGRGYVVADLGPDVPVDSFAAAAAKMPRPLAVAVAVSAGAHDSAVRAIARAVDDEVPGLAVLAGGAGLTGPDHAARLGVQWSGTDARQLAAAIDELDARALR